MRKIENDNVDFDLPTRAKRKIFFTVIGMHVLLLCTPFLIGCFTPDPKPIEQRISVRMITPSALNIENADVGDQNQISQKKQPKIENKPVQTKPKELPKKIEKKKKPVPPKEKPKDKPKETPKEKPKDTPKKKAPEKKTTWADVKDIKIATKTTTIRAQKSEKPTIQKVGNKTYTAKPIDLSNQITEGAVFGNANILGSGTRAAGYDDEVGSYLMSYWDAPSKTSLGGANICTRVRITIQRNGSISKIQMLQKSGNIVFDTSLNELFNTVRTVPLSGNVTYPYTIDINFKPE